MLRYFVILKCEEEKRLRMLRYFVMLKRDVKKKSIACCATL